MNIVNISSNNSEYVKELFIKYLIMSSVPYLLIKYGYYDEIHFSNIILRINYNYQNLDEYFITEDILLNIYRIQQHLNEEYVLKLTNSVPKKIKKRQKHQKKNNYVLKLTKYKYTYDKDSRHRKY